MGSLQRKCVGGGGEGKTSSRVQLLQLMHTFICQASYHDTLVSGWAELVQPLYHNVTYVGPERGVAEAAAKETSM